MKNEELTRIQNLLEAKYQKIVDLPYRSLISGIADYIQFLIDSVLWIDIKQKIKQLIQKDVKYRNKLRSFSFSVAWKEICIAYSTVHGKKDLFDLLDDSYNYSVRLNSDFLKESFYKFHNIVLDEIFRLQNELITNPSLSPYAIDQLPNLLLKDFKGKRYRIQKNMIKVLAEDKEIDNFRLAKCLNSKLTRSRYAENKKSLEGYNEQIKNCFKTLKKYLKKYKYTVRFNKTASRIIRLT